jgi:hypothetical protein
MFHAVTITSRPSHLGLLAHVPCFSNQTYPKSLDRSFEAPRTPTSGSEDEEPVFSQSSAAAATRTESRSDVAQQEEPTQKRKPGGYTSRIEQILYENPNMPILITDAGKSLESGGRYIVYTIRTGVWLGSERPWTFTNSGNRI